MKRIQGGRLVRGAGLGIAIAALILAAAGCGGGAKSAANAKDAKHIVIWEQMDPEERGRFEQNLAAFKSQHPDVTVDHVPYDTEQLRTQFQTAASAGIGPDLVFGPSDQVGPLSLLNLIQPLDETLPAGFFDRFIPAALDTLNGHLWAAPDQVGNHLVLLYNRKLVANPPQSSDEFVALAKKLTTPAKGSEPARYGFAMNTTEPYWLIPFFTGYGGWVMDASNHPTLDSPAMTKALGFLRGLAVQKLMPRESDYQVAETLFKEGQAAMIVNGPWSWLGYRKAGIDLGVAPIFKLPGGDWARPMVASKGYSINVNVPKDKLPLVTELVTFLTSPPAELRSARELGILPSHKDAYGDSTLLQDPLLRASQQAIQLGRRMPVVPEMRVLWDVMRPEMQAVMNGAESPAQAAKNMQQNAVQQIAGMQK